MTAIEGVELKQLQTHPDARGFFREVIRVTDPFFAEGFGQFSHSLMHVGVTKAWHIHPTQIDWWYVPIGALKAALSDRREDSPTFGVTVDVLLGDEHGRKGVKIPAGVAHGCTALADPTHLFYITSRVYDPAEEGRLAHDDPAIGYDWRSAPPIR